MNNNKGFSLPETIVSLAVILLVATSLLPLLSNLTTNLEEKRRKYISSVVMHEAIKMYIAENVFAGAMHIDKLKYTFAIDEKQICVKYEGMREEISNCVSISY
ncbi:competence type IV pilus minor pilin ComGE [Psychrobacillus sp. NPDC058041]|uniref:competence type IV pilus minor pilin ComGE n=1 Tax=Psychrobacillus sp. NPDC058041 TaxID=3346310 RepID=UPI0036DE596D